ARHGPAERAAREVRQNLRRARLLLALVLRVAAEDARAAFRRLCDAGRVVRPDDLHAVEPRDVGHAFARHERLQQIVAFGEAARDERGADAAVARLDVDANPAEAILDGLDLFDLDRKSTRLNS